MKRGIDLVIGSAALLCLFPLMLVVAVSVRLSLGSPVLFRQRRPGLHGDPFVMYKFRTMTENRDPRGRLLPDEQRLGRLGRFLRSTSLDELPELINVVKGEMSLVGPRPLLMEYLQLYTTEQRRRHDVRPGITGWAQIHGRNGLTWEQKFDLDLWYIHHRSMRVDLKILLRTIAAVSRRQGISHPGHATMQAFEGSRSGK